MAKRESSELIRDRIMLELIPQLEQLGKQELINSLTEAVKVGDEKAMDHPQYWEGIQDFAQNGLDIAQWGVTRDGQNTK